MTNAQPAPEQGGDLDTIIGENIHRLMWAARESQSKLAPAWGMTQTALSRKLRGERPWFAAEIDAAARHFRVTRDALFTKLPHLDSNQEPIGYGIQHTETTISLNDYRKAKEEAHKAVRSSEHGNGQAG